MRSLGGHMPRSYMTKQVKVSPGFSVCSTIFVVVVVIFVILHIIFEFHARTRRANISI